MKLAMEYKKAFTVIGKLGEGASSASPDWILPLWQEATQKLEEVSPLLCKERDGAPAGVWGLMGNPREFLGKWTDRGLYLAGFAAADSQSSLKEGWVSWTVPAQTYLTAACTMEEYRQVFSHVTQEYLPKHALEMVGACHELYPTPQDPSKLVLYFPIAKGRLFCQSCGMPLSTLEDLGENADGTACYDYCCHCWDKGQFTYLGTMEEMIETCIPFELEAGVYPDAQTARREMQSYYPTLKRWKKTDAPSKES